MSCGGSCPATISPIALTADFEHFGKLSDNARASVMSAGMRYDF